MRKAENTHDTTGLIYRGTEWSEEERYQRNEPIETLTGFTNSELGVIRQGQIEREWNHQPKIEIKVIMDSIDRKRLLLETETRYTKKDKWKHSGLYETKAEIWYIEFYNLNGERVGLPFTRDDLMKLRMIDGVEEIRGNGIWVPSTGQYKRGYSIPYDCLMIFYQQKLGFPTMEIDRNLSRTEYNRL